MHQSAIVTIAPVSESTAEAATIAPAVAATVADDEPVATPESAAVTAVATVTTVIPGQGGANQGAREADGNLRTKAFV